MTYCLAIKIEEGLVFCSDSRTNAGADRVSTFSKMHQLCIQEDRSVVLMSAGNLATTQAVVERLERDQREQAALTVCNVSYLADLADHIGSVSKEVQQKYAPDGEEAGFNAGASFILGGQIKGQELEMYLIYPEGNHIHPSERYPYFQIGETKYGRPLLERVVTADVPHEIAMRAALVSMDSTMRSNATVGPPIELLYLAPDEFGADAQPAKYHSFNQGDPYLAELRGAWNDAVVEAFNGLPSLDAIVSRR